MSFEAVAASVASAPLIADAYEVLCGELLRQLHAQSCLIEWTGARWEVRTAVAPGSAVDEFIAARTAIDDQLLEFAVHEGYATRVTSVPLHDVGDPPLLLVVEGDWSWIREQMVSGAIVLRLALRIVRERATGLEIADLLVGAYARIRRLSRLGGVEAVARRVVKDVAEMLRAERVSLAMFRADTGVLSIVATEGTSLDAVPGVRIIPGDWVIGHVFKSRRPVFVRDVKVLPSLGSHPTAYRTSSFAAVPMLAGSEVVGVITATDKRGEEVFTRRDELVLRTLSAAAAVALVAARSNDEVTRLAHAATIDSLTGLLNRPGFEKRLYQEIERARRESGSLAMLMADVDDFKTINDTRGHQVGDEVLKLVGSVIRSSIRVFDLCARYGGDEFAVVMPTSDRESAIQSAERIRARLTEHSMGDDPVHVSISIGVAVMAAGDTATELLARADQCLYRAKADGKNVVRADSPHDARAPITQELVRIDAPIIQSEGVGADRDVTDAGTGTELRYVLVVDSHADRAALCLDAVAPFQVGFLKARDGQQARSIIDRFGSPMLLVIDLSLSANNGFELVEYVRARHGERSEVIAWSASRDIREYAGARLSGLNIHVIAGNAARSTMRSAIEGALERKTRAPKVDMLPPAVPLWTGEQTQRIIGEATYQARRIVRAAGVAVYLRPPGEHRYRASFSWESDDPIPHAATHLPRAVHDITTTGRSVNEPDLSGAGGDNQDAVRGLAGVPILCGPDVVGALCVFDTETLSVSNEQAIALESLGRRVVDTALSEPAPTDAPGPQTAPSTANRSIATLMRSATDWPPALLERVGGEFAVARELARARRDGIDLSVVLFEIAPLSDGIEFGKSVEHACDALLRTIRQSDLPIRWSGREFLVVLPGLSGPAARAVAERVRTALQVAAQDRVAVAGGVAKLEGEESFGDLVSRARARVRLARGSDHNRIV